MKPVVVITTVDGTLTRIYFTDDATAREFLLSMAAHIDSGKPIVITADTDYGNRSLVLNTANIVKAEVVAV